MNGKVNQSLKQIPAMITSKTLSMNSYYELRDLALECVATVTSSINCSANEQNTDIKQKSSSSDYVTSLDRQIESETVQFIRENRTSDGILGEEGAFTSGTSGVRWIIDPIDGTSNFVYGIPYFSISIAIEAEGEIVAGVVADLSSNDTFDAVKGHGSRCNNEIITVNDNDFLCLLYTSPSPRDRQKSRMPSSA